LGETELSEESIQLLVKLANFGVFILNNLRENLFELILHGADCRRNEVTQFVVKFGGLVDFVSHRNEVHKVLELGLGNVGTGYRLLVVNRLVLVVALLLQRLRFFILGLKVLFVWSSQNVSKLFGLLKVRNRLVHVPNGETHSFACISRLLELPNAQLPIRLGLEVFGVVAHHICKLAIVEGAKSRVHLV